MSFSLASSLSFRLSLLRSLTCPQLHGASTLRTCSKLRAADVGNRDSVSEIKGAPSQKIPTEGDSSFSGLDRWKHSLPAYINPTNNSGPKSWIVESPSVNFISHHGRVCGTGCMPTNVMPLRSIVGLQWIEGLLWSCSRPAGELLLCITLSCKLLSPPPSFLLTCLFSIMVPCYAWVSFVLPPLFFFLPFLSICLILLLELCLGHDGMDVGT